MIVEAANPLLNKCEIYKRTWDGLAGRDVKDLSMLVMNCWNSTITLLYALVVDSDKAPKIRSTEVASRAAKYGVWPGVSCLNEGLLSMPS